MRLWVDNARPAPDGYTRSRSVENAKLRIQIMEDRGTPFSLIDIDHYAGEFAKYGGDYINLLDWLEETGRSYPIRIHSINPVGVENMRRIIQKNGWTEVR